jgi:hypothetical protein
MTKTRDIAAQANAAIEAGKPHEAAELFQRVLKREPNHEDALSYLAQYALQSGQLDAAISLLAQRLQTAPQDHYARRSLGEALEAQGRFADAEAQYRQAILARRDDGMAWAYLAVVLNRQDKAEAAAQAAALAFSAQQDLIAYAQSPNVWIPARARISEALDLRQNKVLALHEAVVAEAADAGRLSALIYPGFSTPPISYASPNQQPWALYAPDLPDDRWFDLPDGVTEKLVASVPAALPSALALTVALRRRFGASAPETPHWREVNLLQTGGWSNLVSTLLPSFTEAVEQVMGEVPQVAYAVAVSAGGSSVPLGGQSNAHAAVLVPLRGPEEGVTLTVDGEAEPVRAGKAVAFDASFQHHITNASPELFEALVFEMPRPDLTDGERAALAASLAAVSNWADNLAV